MLLPLPFQTIELPARLKFGFYLNDNLFHTSPACQRAVLETVDALRTKGHEVVELDPPDAVRAMQIFVAFTSADGFAGLLDNLQGDPAEPSLFILTLQKKIGPTAVRWLSALLYRLDPKVFSITRLAGAKQAIDVHHWHAERDRYVTEVRQRLWGDLKLDGVIGEWPVGRWVRR
jgi:Asp-tRNA(Asn)/Glu-tRNA(Gln) amidotransferase A subunit family amidase